MVFEELKFDQDGITPHEERLYREIVDFLNWNESYSIRLIRENRDEREAFLNDVANEWDIQKPGYRDLYRTLNVKRFERVKSAVFMLQSVLIMRLNGKMSVSKKNFHATLRMIKQNISTWGIAIDDELKNILEQLEDTFKGGHF